MKNAVEEFVSYRDPDWRVGTIFCHGTGWLFNDAWFEVVGFTENRRASNPEDLAVVRRLTRRERFYWHATR